MSELLATQHVPVDAGGPKAAHAKRSPASSFALHATLIVASLIAIFPIAWVVASSFKPGVWVNSSDLSRLAAVHLPARRSRSSRWWPSP